MDRGFLSAIMAYGLIDSYGGGRRGGRGFDPFFDDHYGFEDPFGGPNRDHFAPVSERAMNAQENARKIFLNHLATVDTSRGAVTHEIIDFHLVQDMKNSFNKFVREHGCVPKQRKLTREEQDKFNKSRKSLMQYTSVTVTPEAQRKYIEKNPEAAKKARDAAAARQGSTSAESSSAPARQASASSGSASTSTVPKQAAPKAITSAAPKQAAPKASVSAAPTFRAGFQNTFPALTAMPPPAPVQARPPLVPKDIDVGGKKRNAAAAGLDNSFSKDATANAHKKLKGKDTA